MSERRFITYELLVHFSDRDLRRVLIETESTIILRACKDLNAPLSMKIADQYTDKGREAMEADFKKISPISDDECRVAQDLLSSIADRLLTEDELEDFQLKKAS